MCVNFIIIFKNCLFMFLFKVTFEPAESDESCLKCGVRVANGGLDSLAARLERAFDQDEKRVGVFEQFFCRGAMFPGK